jgi:hypothetical protein
LCCAFRCAFCGPNTVVARLDSQGVPHPDLDAKSPRGVVGRNEIVLASHGS